MNETHGYRWEQSIAAPNITYTLYRGAECAGVLMAITNYWEDEPHWKYFHENGYTVAPLGYLKELTDDEAKNMALSIVITGVDMRGAACAI